MEKRREVTRRHVFPMYHSAVRRWLAKALTPPSSSRDLIFRLRLKIPLLSYHFSPLKQAPISIRAKLPTERSELEQSVMR